MSVTARGGYQIVDVMGKLFSADNPFYTIPGIYNKALNQVKKPCYFGNVRILNGKRILNVPFQLVTFEISDNNLSCDVKTGDPTVPATFVINANDEIALD